MVDQKTVLKGLECCVNSRNNICPLRCPYFKVCMEKHESIYPLLRDAMEVLKRKSGHEKRVYTGLNARISFSDELIGEINTETERKKTMTLNEYQQKAMRTSSTKFTSSEHLMNGCLGLAGEAGECCDLLKKSRFQDGREIREKLLDELGDVLWYVAETASALFYSLEDVAEHNIKKLMDRYPEGFDPERSLHRNE